MGSFKRQEMADRTKQLVILELKFKWHIIRQIVDVVLQILLLDHGGRHDPADFALSKVA